MSIQQDLKLAVVGDEKRGYDAFTTDALIRLEMHGKPNHIGYVVVFPEYEFADIEGKYHRYSFNAGSALSVNSSAIMAIINTHISSCLGALTFVIVGYI